MRYVLVLLLLPVFGGRKGIKGFASEMKGDDGHDCYLLIVGR